jgi:hypothetical protein
LWPYFEEDFLKSQGRRARISVTAKRPQNGKLSSKFPGEKTLNVSVAATLPAVPAF